MRSVNARGTQTRHDQGFAILLSLLLVLILTIFGYWMLLIAENHYAASRMLYDSENARIISEAGATKLVLQHNSQEPRFFTDPQTWNGLELKPRVWNGYRFTGRLAAPWDPAGMNMLNLHVQKARSFANLELPVRQMRFEDFAFFSDAAQTLPPSTLFDGIVFSRGGLIVDRPARFREAVYNDVSPSFYASYRKPNRIRLDFPFSMQTVSNPNGLNITGQDPRFWQINHYYLNLDQLELWPRFSEWEVRYKGIVIGQTSRLALAFDRSVRVSQTYREITHFPSGKTQASLYIVSSEDVSITSSVQSLQGSLHEHPLCFYSGKEISVLNDRCSIRIEACLISSGESSIHVSTGIESLSDDEKQSWLSEIRSSVFIVEPEKKVEFLEALNANRKIVWFRGSVGIKGSFVIAPDINQLHFESCRALHNFIPSFPFVQIVEGRRKWL